LRRYVLEKGVKMYKTALGVPESHTLEQTDTKWEQRKGQDTDTYWYDEKNEAGDIVAKFIIRDSTCIYPPQSRNIQYEKLSATGEHLESGAISPREV